MTRMLSAHGEPRHKLYPEQRYQDLVELILHNIRISRSSDVTRVRNGN